MSRPSISAADEKGSFVVTGQRATASPDWREELQALVAAHPGASEVVVFPPSIGWRLPFLFQRPQQMAVALARSGCLVLYCEPDYPGRHPDGFSRVENRLYVANVPLDVFSVLESPVVVVLAYSGQHLHHFHRPQVVYDHLDSTDLAEIRAEFPRAHRLLLGRATVVLATATRLWEGAVRVRPDALLSPNAVDFDFFHDVAAGRRPQVPEDLRRIAAASSSIVGYTGVLSREWVDYELIRAAAAALPDTAFVLVGIDYDGSLRESRILDCPNVHWLGPRPYAALPAYLAWFDAALIPFVINELTCASSPVKLFEYLAAAVPTVSTDLPECRKYPAVLLAEGREQIAGRIVEALRRRADPAWRAQAEAIARANTWEARARQLLDALREARDPQCQGERLRSQVDQLGMVAGDAESLVAEQRREIATLRAAVAERDHQIRQREQTALGLQAALRKEVASRHETLPKLHAQIVEQERQLEAACAELELERRRGALAAIRRSFGGPSMRLQQVMRHARRVAIEALQRPIGRYVPYEVRSRLRRALGLAPRPLRQAEPLGPAPVGQPDGLPTTGYDVICFPIIAWSFRFQRPQQLMTQLARAGHRVFYLNPQSLLEGELIAGDGPEPRVAPIGENLFDVRLPACDPLNLYQDTLDPVNCEAMYSSLVGLAHRFRIATAVAIVQLPFWAHLALRTRELGWKIVYDCMDEHGGFESNSAGMVAREQRLLAASDHVLASSHALLEKVRGEARGATLVPNACDFAQFSRPPELLALPADLAGATHPIVGYYGAISAWFDFDLIRHAARSHPEWTFVLIGSTWGAPPHDDLRDLPNLRFLGEKPYAELPAYLAHFDVATIPFTLSPLIEATSPVKFFEYLAAGKPVVASEIPELVPHRDLAWLARGAPEFTRAIEEALECTGPEDRARRRAFAAQHTWAARHELVGRAIDEVFGLVSVIVVTWNNLEYTRQCIDAVLADATWPCLELIVVDNASTDGTVEYLEELDRREPRVRVVRNAENRGFAAANNQGLALARGRYVVLLNNDTVVTRGWLGRLLRHLDADERIGLIGPVTNNVWNEARQEAGYSDLAGLAEFAERWAWEHAGRLYPIAVLAMYCVAARREVVERVGPLDEGFGIGMFEDDDYAHRVRALGYRVVCAEEVYVHHAGRASFAKLPEPRYLALHDENRRRFEEKWGITWKQHGGDRRQTLLWRDRVDALLAEHAEHAGRAGRAGVVVFPPTIGWSIDLFQRPHQLALAFARLGHVVVFCLHDYDAPEGRALREVAPGVILSSVPLEAFEGVRGARVMVMPYNAGYAVYFAGARVVYEIVDDLAVFPGDPAVLRRHHESLLRSADVVLATADSLLEAARRVRPDAILNPNGVDYEHFADGAGPIPAEIATLGGPIVGYFGALARWFDYELVRHAARERAELQFVLIGPDHDGTLARSGLTELRNVHVLGPRPYRELPAYLRAFDVATIPFAVDEITRAVSPIKLFEYMAGGKPVVTSSLPECRKYPEVLVAESPQDFVRCIDLALAGRADPVRIAALRRRARENTWDERARAILAAVARRGE